MREPSLMDQVLTEGAQRVLDTAGRIAQQSAADEISPLHLLWALLLDESQAADILAEYGVTIATFEQLTLQEAPLMRVTVDAGGAPPETVPQRRTKPTPLPLSPPAADAFAQAQRQAALAGRHAAVGTEHLLFGLVAAESPLRDVFTNLGLTADTLARRAGEKSGFSSEPIEVDVNLELSPHRNAAAQSTLRILDAAANRAREGLRVLEDYTRFVLDDAHLTGRLKDCRHALAAALRTVPGSDLLAARDTLHDVGTSISTEAESLRAAPLDVVQANFKRVQEALRSLEEYGKVIAPPLGRTLEQLRYELYTLERAVWGTEHNRRRLEGRDLYVLVTESQCRRGSGPAVREACSAGAGMVQMREKSMADRALLEHARRLREWTREAGALFIVNDRPDIADLVDADGVHLGQDDLSVREARRIVGPGRLVGVSTHTIDQARQAVLDGADYLGVGPVFPSSTKKFDQLAGLDFVRAVAAEISLPWFAIGGIDEKNLSHVLEAGATRVAVSCAVCQSEEPGRAAAALLASLHRARS